MVWTTGSVLGSGVEGIPVNDHGSSCAEMVFEMAGVGTDPA